MIHSFRTADRPISWDNKGPKGRFYPVTLRL
jgi:hypothetical protein